MLLAQLRELPFNLLLVELSLLDGGHAVGSRGLNAGGILVFPGEQFRRISRSWCSAHLRWGIQLVGLVSLQLLHVLFGTLMRLTVLSVGKFGVAEDGVLVVKLLVVSIGLTLVLKLRQPLG